MTDPVRPGRAMAAGPGPAPSPTAVTPAAPPSLPGSVAGQAVPIVPDDTVMILEIDRDRRHERYLVRAALVACIVIAVALAIRMVWG